jgi:tellurite resistance protein TehA-like permease
MATGIIAVGAWQQDLDVAASVLFAVASAALIVLLVLNLVRLVAHSGRFVADLTHHGWGFAFLTAVAALDVVGSGAALIHGWWGLAWVCWIAAMVSWVVLLYPALLAVVLDDEKPDLSVGINGTWFLLTVSTESIAVLGAVLLVRTGPNQAIELIALSTFVLGIVLYLIVMTLLFLRWTFRPVSPAELQPPSWIAAGALAITVLAGSTLLSSPDRLPRIERLAPFLEGLVLLAWATATFWLPVMVAMGVWRHGIRRVPLSYHPSMWSMVFPIGMYGVATFRMIPVTGFTGLDMVPKVVLGIATVAWAATAVGTVRSLTSR